MLQKIVLRRPASQVRAEQSNASNWCSTSSSWWPATKRISVSSGLKMILPESWMTMPWCGCVARNTCPSIVWRHSAGSSPAHSGHGGSIPRAYIGEFLGGHEADIRGRVLEIASDRYASQFAADVNAFLAEAG